MYSYAYKKYMYVCVYLCIFVYKYLELTAFVTQWQVIRQKGFKTSFIRFNVDMRSHIHKHKHKTYAVTEIE